MTREEYEPKLKELETLMAGDPAKGTPEGDRLNLLAMDLEIYELHEAINLRMDADRRAIKHWQEAHPGHDDEWPDHADLCVWLMEQLDKLEAHHETRS